MRFVTCCCRVLLILALLLPALANPGGVQAAPPAHDPAEHIANAERAAPAAIAHDATVMGWDEEGMPTVVLREGTNGWTCYDDWPVSPGNDPACYDAVFDAWNVAMMAGTEPAGDGTGIAYMLAGGSDPSNTDPFAMAPAEGEEWISTPPHIMIITVAGFDAADFATEPKQDEPYIMWDGTPYEHLMVPVVPMAVADMGDADADLQNTMSSAPAGIVHKATIMGSPAEEGGEMVVLQEGDSGWVCYPDRTVSPGNDPSCNDGMWEALFATPEPPDVTRTGVSYMLAGGSDESNTDPMVTGPEAGAEWIATPPHIMLLTPGGYDANIFTTDHGSGYPYIMWDGTPYEHLMIPVADIPGMDMGDMHGDAAAEDEALRTEVLALEFATFDHLRGHDVDAVRAETSEDFISLSTDGSRGGLEDYVAFVADPDFSFDEPVREEVESIVISPDGVLVFYILQTSGTYQGEPFTNRERLASLWQKRGDRWLNTFLQASPVAAAAESDANDMQIANAESAAPAAIAMDAAIMGYDEDGMPTVVLREGTNGWTCYVNWPASPGNDPSCLDAVFNAWNVAMMAGEEPAGDGTGIAYMLAGGSDPSNTDPFAMAPAEGEEWISTPPHIMIITAAGFDAADFASEPRQDEPYIMWDDTPYEHLMVPVVPTPDELLGEVDEETANTLRSAPAGVALNATIMGNPETEGDPMVVVKEGTNGWICYPDGAVSPGNDPACNDPMMEAFWSIGDTEGVTRAGLSYMLQGGSDASNTDPMLSSPPEGEAWVATAPHVMLVVPGGFDTTHFSTDHMSGLPYVMFADTGYQHIMIPVADMPEMNMSK